MVADAVSVEAERASDCWRTPEYILDRARDFDRVANRRVADPGWIALDPCTSTDNPTRARRYITREEDGLTTPWELSQGDVVWLNPPYSRGQVRRWIAVWGEEQERVFRAVHVIALLKSDPSTEWHTQARRLASAVCRVSSRVRFVSPVGAAATGANFASDIFYGGLRPHLFADVFRYLGYVEVLR